MDDLNGLQKCGPFLISLALLDATDTATPGQPIPDAMYTDGRNTSMETVWIRLTTTGVKYLVNGVEQKRKDPNEYFMFGPTGIVRFHTEGGMTSLFSARSMTSVAMVEETSEYIMDILRKMRRTEGRLSAKQKTKKRSKSKTSKTKISR